MSDWEKPLLCPFCGFDCTHIVKVWALEGGDPGEPEGCSSNGELYGIPVGGVSAERRGAVVVEVEGECGHCFEMVFQQHKGTTFIQYRILDKVPGWTAS